MPQRSLPSLPTGYSSRWLGEKLEISHPWRRSWGLGMLVFSAAATFVGWQLAKVGFPPGAILLLSGPPFVLPALAYLVNRTKFTMDVSGLVVKDRPLPFKRKRTFHRAELSAVNVTPLGSDDPSWYVGLELKLGGHVYVVGGGADRDEAFQVAEVIAEHMGLPPPRLNTEASVVGYGVPAAAPHDAIAAAADQREVHAKENEQSFVEEVNG